MLTPVERAGLRSYLQGLPDTRAFRTPCLSIPAAQPPSSLADLVTQDEHLPSVAAHAEFGDPPAPVENQAALAEALTGLKVLLDLARVLPLSRAAAVLVERVRKTSRRLETQLARGRSA